ncbi:MAG: HAMP domain-containing sensor histidine kinase, partial [Mycobacteriales bacterium]
LAAGLGAALGRRAVRPLAEALSLQRAFVADASHELRTPLTLLSTRAQLLDSSLAADGVPQQVREDSAGVVADVRRLGEVLEDLLLAADPRQMPDTVRVDVSELSAQVVDSALPYAATQGVSLSCTAADNCIVLGAPAALRRAVLALVDNAIDHTPHEGRVTVTVSSERHLIVVTVADTGPGIAPQAADAALQRFHSGGQRSGRAHYGLGLTLTHDVANRHGGGLRLVPSQVGATFELRLPRAD